MTIRKLNKIDIAFKLIISLILLVILSSCGVSKQWFNSDNLYGELQLTQQQHLALGDISTSAHGRITDIKDGSSINVAEEYTSATGASCRKVTAIKMQKQQKIDLICTQNGESFFVPPISEI